MAINFKKCSCLRIGQRFDVASANYLCPLRLSDYNSLDFVVNRFFYEIVQNAYYGQTIQWETELKYLGIHIVCSRGFKCALTAAKRLFYKAANAVFCKIGGRSSEDVILQLIRSKCMSAILYGLEACPLRLSDYNSLDFVVNRFLWNCLKRIT